jgi:hypothetical protein
MSAMQQVSTVTAFDGHRLIASGALPEVALACKHALDAGASAVLIFDDGSGRPVEVDFRGTPQKVLARLQAKQPARGPGRPRLGVIAREVTLLPRHWEWLGEQPGGASAVLRRLVEEAARGNLAKQRARRSAEALDRVMRDLAGDLPDYEEASRAFWRREPRRFATLTKAWPKDVRDHLRKLAAIAWDDAATADA